MIQALRGSSAAEISPRNRKNYPAAERRLAIDDRAIDRQGGDGIVDASERFRIVVRRSGPQADLIAVFAGNGFLVVSAPGATRCCKSDASRASLPRALLKL
jgi:hypothetical protein